MGELVFKLPDVGEGVAEAELVEWHVKIGDVVREDELLAAVMSDKATVEIPSPAEGEIIWLGAEVGDRVAVGSDLVRLKIPGEDSSAGKNASAKFVRVNDVELLSKGEVRTEEISRSNLVVKPIEDGEAETSLPETSLPKIARSQIELSSPHRMAAGPRRPEGSKPMAAPAVRLRAREAGVDLRQVRGSGPAGRITHEDLDAFLARDPGTMGSHILQVRTAVQDIKLTGLRRMISEKMSIARRIPDITYVEEVDVTTLEELRTKLNQRKQTQQGPKLTLLPFLMRAMVQAIAEQPHFNALFDEEAGIIRQYAGVHIGIAAQTPAGLMVPVVKHAEALDLWACAAEVNRLAEAARAGTATRDELTGSTITITSLGSMGGVASTPIINHPEVAIIGVNKIMTRPVWEGGAFIPRKMMNLSSSFDHRVIDGWDAAVFVQQIKALLETPALIFMDG